jgi:hypothetical protein
MGGVGLIALPGAPGCDGVMRAGELLGQVIIPAPIPAAGEGAGDKADPVIVELDNGLPPGGIPAGRDDGHWLGGICPAAG